MSTAHNRGTSNLATAREYVLAIERGATGEALARFLTDDVVHQLFPNRLAPQGKQCDLAEMLASAEKGQQLVTNQSYEIQQEMESGERVALEVIWTGELAVPVAGLKAGDKMRAHFAVFFDFRSGRIAAQRNYDCFDSW